MKVGSKVLDIHLNLKGTVVDVSRKIWAKKWKTCTFETSESIKFWNKIGIIKKSYSFYHHKESTLFNFVVKFDNGRVAFYRPEKENYSAYHENVCLYNCLKEIV